VNEKQPRTLLEVILFFQDESKGFEAVRDRRWPDGNVSCPRCGCEAVRFMEKRKTWNCNDCRKQFSIKTGTIFEESPIPFSKWLPAMWLIVNAKNGISSCELARSIDVTQKTAWFMLHRIRLAMDNGSIEKLNGEVEADETFVGGKAKNQHKWQRVGKGRGSSDKAAVHGMIERGGRVVAMTVPNLEGPTLRGYIERHVSPTATIYTDEFKAYALLGRKFDHHVIDHMVSYVEGNIHTNSIENFWSLLKRGLKGTYISVEPFHLFRYVEEQVFRFNERKATDGERFQLALSQVVNRRIKYSELIGKVSAAGN
jgi:transposase-like protein